VVVDTPENIVCWLLAQSAANLFPYSPEMHGCRSPADGSRAPRHRRPRCRTRTHGGEAPLALLPGEARIREPPRLQERGAPLCIPQVRFELIAPPTPT
jgi:hypothetical protein